jgi:hypothetical protein
MMITVQTTTGPMAIRARVFGKLAVHRALTGDNYPENWSITHIPTGLAVKSAATSDKRQALFFAKRLAELPLWDFKRPSLAKKRHAEIKTAWEAILGEWKAKQ